MEAQRTIRVYYGLAAIMRLGISSIAATYVIFLTSRGLTLFEVGLVNAVFHTVMFLGEIPTGAIADVFGRKVSYVISCLLLAVGTFVYGVSDSLPGFMLAEVIAAIGGTCASGAFQAWMVDQVKHHGGSVCLQTVFAREQQIGTGAAMVGALLGATLGGINLAWPWFAGGVIMTIATVCAHVFMKEEYFVRTTFSLRGSMTTLCKTIHASFRYCRHSQVIRFVMLMGIVQSFVLMAPNMHWQPLFREGLGGTVWLGVLFVAMQLSLVAGAGIAKALRRGRNNPRTILMSIHAVIGAGVVFTVLPKTLAAMVVFFLLHEVARGAYVPICSAYLNEHIPSQQRATILSFKSMVAFAGSTSGLLVTGALAEAVSIKTTWVFAGAMLIIGTLLIALRVRNGKY